MNDFDEVRTCCTGAGICSKCWPFMTVFIKVTDHILRGMLYTLNFLNYIFINIIIIEDFGFQHILWVFSGRRGVHCWVCDPRARKLSLEARRSIVEFLSIVQVSSLFTKQSCFRIIVNYLK